ncbi:hypothetical protein JHD47_00280 [Sulfurimonas sp. SAG-AH-194-L11]|nr:hypothetical protein [Sulfurimonas sp. SAG-AH-194-L11]MDF1876250.1 hypothetical protein [Sulfurimonas sp. SAG-AH-194-L11]
MGGFEGGDEGGFWDEDAIETLIKKQNNKKTSTKAKVLVKSINGAYTLSGDPSISIVPSSCASFTIEDSHSIPLESNTIYKTYKALLEFTCDSDIEELFSEHKVVVSSYTPTTATSFLLLTKELCNLVLSENELQFIEQKAL